MSKKVQKAELLHHRLAILYFVGLFILIFLVFFMGINFIDIMEDIRDILWETWG